MPIDITSAGGTGTHTFTKVSVNLDENYVYFKNTSSGTTIPTALADSVGLMFRNSTGSISGITNNSIVYIKRANDNTISFATTVNGDDIDLTDITAGTITLNKPYVNANRLNIESVFPNQQAVRYLTAGTPIGGLTSGEVYYAKSSAQGYSSASALYAFTSHTFTTCGSTGRLGPTQSQMRASYETAWDEKYLSQGTFQGYQDWTVPVSGIYEFDVKGPSGTVANGGVPGRGARMRARVALTKGEVITMIVGQRGERNPANPTWAASSGGTFVVRKNGGVPLLAAGGGSSTSNTTNGFDATTSTSGRSVDLAAGTNGNGAPGGSAGGGGGGFFSRGGNSSYGQGGGTYADGFLGGLGTACGNGSNGGFGGGAGSDACAYGAPGGAGGYSGGSAGSARGTAAGGGGGSFITSTATNVATSDGFYNGSTTFNGTAVTNLNSWNASGEGEIGVTLVSTTAGTTALYLSGDDAATDTNPIAITPAGNNYHALIPVNVDTVDDIINNPTPHGFNDSESISYSFPNGTSPVGGLTPGEVYYVKKIDEYSYQISLTPGPTYNPINLTSPASATSNTINRVIVNTATDTLTINGHGFLVNQTVTYRTNNTPSTSGQIVPLQDGATYYVREVVDANRIKLANSIDGDPINITAAGIGTAHSFIFVTVNATENSLYLPSHGYVDGQAVRYQKSGTISTITNVSRSGTRVTITTQANHGLIANDFVSIDSLTGANQSILNLLTGGNYRVQTVPSATQFTYDVATSGTLNNQAATGFASRYSAPISTRALTGSTNITITTGNAHGLSQGNRVILSGVTGSNADIFNGTYSVTSVINTTQFVVTRSALNYTIVSKSQSGTTATVATSAPHGLVAGNVVEISGVGGTLPANFNGSRTIVSVPSSTTFTFTTTSGTVATEASTGNVQLTSVPSASVSGNAVVDTAVQGLRHARVYYVDAQDTNIIKLSTTKNLQNIVNITDPGIGTHTLITTSVDYDTDSITLPRHGFTTGELVQYDAKGQTVINGLTTSTPYYAIVVDGDNIKLATTSENATNGVAIDLLATPPAVGTHSIRSLIKTPDGIYTIKTVPTETTFTVEASGRVPSITKTFTPRQAVDLQQNAVYIPSHGFLTGTKLSYDAEGNTAVEGLTDLTDYYVVGVNRDYFRLATNLENSLSGVVLTLSGFGTGVDHTFTTTQINGNVTGAGSVTIASGSVRVNGTGTQFSKILKVGDRFRMFPPNVTLSKVFTSANVNTTTNQITISSHTFNTADSVRYNANGGAVPSPLVEDNYYFVRSVDANTVTLHNSPEEATLNTNAVDFSTQGSGTGHTLTRTTPSFPIIRKITAIGSDTQLTVDRPYTSDYTAVSYSYPTFIYVRPQGYSLHRPFDGGVEMSAGADTSFGQIIRQTRKYFRYQSGKGLQTSFGINFKPSLDLEALYRVSSTTVRGRTRRPHGLKSGLFIEVSGSLDSFGTESTVYNGIFQITVLDDTNFTFIANTVVPEAPEDRAYGFPQLYVTEWSNGAIRSGMFDFQNGMFFEFDGQKIYAVRRSSTQQIAGTVSALQGSEVVYGVNTLFEQQLNAGDYIVLRGQSYRVSEVVSDTQISIRPEYKGSSGTEVEFNPATVVSVDNDSFTILNHGFVQDLPVVYDSIDGTPIGGLINGRTYYVDIVDNNVFKLKGSIDALTDVSISSAGSGNPHSFTPARTGIIATLTVDTRVPQEEWNIDPCDGTGPTGYNLDLSRIQMAYIDYSWYGAGKIRFGFKTTSGEVQYVHEFVHNNNLFESYFRSGNLPTRYEVVTFENPTYIPFLFHWGTSVIMDGKFDDDRAYLFTASGQSLNIAGTTAKSFGQSAISLTTDLITISSHGFTTGDTVQFQSIASGGVVAKDNTNPQLAIAVSGNQQQYLTTNSLYYIRVIDVNTIALFPSFAYATATPIAITSASRSGSLVTVNTTTNHGLTTGNTALITGMTGAAAPMNGAYVITVNSATQFTYTTPTSGTISALVGTPFVSQNPIAFVTTGTAPNTFFLFPQGSANNSSGSNYQPLLSLRLSPSVSSGLAGKLGERDVINRMQLRLRQLGIQTTQSVDVKLLLNARLNNLNFQNVDSPSLTQIIEHTASDTVSGGVQVYNFRASGQNGTEQSTTTDIADLFELSNSILGGDSIFPDGPDIITIAVARLTGNPTVTSARLTWTEAQA